jgi:hypothetical protein
MPIYTVHAPPERRRESRRGPDRFRFVRDGFHFWAFLLTPLWLLWRRLFLAFIGYAIVAAAIAAAVWATGAPQTLFAAEALFSLLIGFEAGTLQRLSLRMRRWREVGLVSADSLEGAERRFFDTWDNGVPRDLNAPPVPPIVPPAAASPPDAPPPSSFLAGGRPLSSTPGVIGLFPEPGGAR